MAIGKVLAQWVTTAFHFLPNQLPAVPATVGALLDRQLGAAPQSSPLQYITTALGAHTCTKTVNPLTASLLWLPRTFWHSLSPLYVNIHSARVDVLIPDQQDAVLYSGWLKTANQKDEDTPEL